ncbi:MAG: heme exporter protein CcmD [Gammaproteobacteria bacterium]|nr:MAG: heme exporter protein CcmD [Gammaproteobacteria bacterium]
MTDALAMGGYGVYVWSCFGLTLIVIIICTVQAWRRHRTIFNNARTQIRAMKSD